MRDQTKKHWGKNPVAVVVHRVLIQTLSVQLSAL